jgi:16S rRNA (cytidine1402-2'-O)-methyltransferase
MSGILYVVATPIGNLEDVTFRAKRVLGEVEAVLAEDTRRTRQLLSHLGISKPLRRLDANVEGASVDRIAEEIARGGKLALVSDAGTPVVNDPGAELVRAVIAHGARVECIPGASAVLSALVVSGLATNAFRFVGFLPRSGGERNEALARIVETPEPVVLFEAGNRVRETIADLAARTPDRRAAIARELTKLHEQVLRGTLDDLSRQLEGALLGEVTIVLGAREEQRTAADDDVDDAAIDARIDAELAAGRSAKDAADIVAAWSGRKRRDVYARTVARRAASKR